MKRLSYEATVRSCFVAYIVQAIINNFAPLLFVTFQRDFGISLSEVTLLITFNFLIQILVDLASAYFVDRIGYRAAMITAHLLSAASLLLLSELPFMISNAYIALLISVAIYAIGGGLLEVVVSPPDEEQGEGDEHASFLLLLGICHCDNNLNIVLPYIRNRGMESNGKALDACSSGKYDCILLRSYL